MKKLQEISSKKTKLCIGLMSGTSMDGVDAALVQITGSGLETNIQMIGSLLYPYPAGLKAQLVELIARDNSKISEISQLNFLIGEIFADAVDELLKKSKISADEVDLIGSHGQTVWHNPDPQELFEKQISSTLQIGESSVINARTGIVTVADFRAKDVALGGIGAPLIPYFDYLMFRSNVEHRGVLNIGGIANITVIPKEASLDQVKAFDTGPGNMVTDRAMNILFGKAMDENGSVAEKSEFDRSLLALLMEHPFVAKKPPKSTGREDFNDNFVRFMLAEGEKLKATPEEVISTLTEFTVCSLKRNYELFIKTDQTLDRMIVSGGGTKNRELMKRLRLHFPDMEVEPIEDHDGIDIPSDFKEAVAFAVYANEAVSGNAINIPNVTGARESSIMGKVIV